MTPGRALRGWELCMVPARSAPLGPPASLRLRGVVALARRASGPRRHGHLRLLACAASASASLAALRSPALLAGAPGPCQ